jgi:hypothetical protein
VRKLLVVLVVVNLLLGVLLFALRPPARAASATSASPAELPAQVAELQRRIGEGRHQEPYALVLTEPELDSLVGYVLAKRAEVPVDRARVSIAGQRLVVDGVTRGLAVTLPVRALIALGAQGGRPAARLEDVSLGDTPVPGFLRDELLRRANASLDFSRYDLAVTVTSVQFQPGSLRVSGTIK